MQLSGLADVRMGYPFRTRLEHEPMGDVVVLQMKDIDDSNIVHADGAMRVSLPKVGAHHRLRPGDLLFRSRGRSNGAALVPEDIVSAVLAAPMLLIRPRKVLPAYLCWYINEPTTQDRLAAVAEGTSVKMISAEALKALDVPLPSLARQQHIAQVAALAEREHALSIRIARLRQQLTNHHLLTIAQEAAT